MVFLFVLRIKVCLVIWKKNEEKKWREINKEINKMLYDNFINEWYLYFRWILLLSNIIFLNEKCYIILFDFEYFY